MDEVLGPEREKGLVFIVSAPAGTGKTTLVQMLAKEFISVKPSVSYTTRKPRDGEVTGVDYHFISAEEFEKKIAAGDFLEYVKLYDTFYGTSRQWVEEQTMQGQHIVLVIDTQGAMSLKGVISAVYIFVRPPSLEVLRNRLSGRQTETEAIVETRLEWAKQELLLGGLYDYQIINDRLEIAYEVLRSIVIAECHKIKKQKEY